MSELASGTRQRLVDAAAACVRDRGVAGASSRAITREAGANLAAITYHFGSKDELVAEALLGTIRRALDPALAALRRNDLDAPARVMLAVAALRSSFAASSEDAPGYVEALVQARHLPTLQAGLLELVDELREFFAAQITVQQDAGQLPGWILPRPMATLILAVLNGIVLQAVLDPAGTDVDALAGQFVALLLAAGQP